MRLWIAFIALIFSESPSKAEEYSAVFGKSFKENYADYESFKFWVLGSDRSDCGISSLLLQRKLYQISTTYVQPRLEWWINGQPSGATVKVSITSQRLSPDLCAHAINNSVVYFAKYGNNSPNIIAKYLDLGPYILITNQKSEEDLDNFTQVILSQLSFFFDLYRNGGSRPPPRP